MDLKRILIILILAISFCLSLHSLIIAQGSYPTKPVTIWVGFPPGGATDTLIRALAEATEKPLGQRIVVINKPGAGGAVATSLLVKEKPDGYILAAYPDTPVTRAPHLRDLDYDPFRDLSFIILVGLWKNIIVVKSDSPFKKWSEVVEWARKNPGQLTYGNPGAGTTPYLAMPKIASIEKFTFKTIPFAGDAPNVSAVLGGHVMIGGGSAIAWIPHIEAKTIRALLVFEKEGLDLDPEVPTFEKVGYNFETPTSVIITAPHGIPDNVREVLEKAFIEGIKTKMFRDIAKRNEFILREPLTGNALRNYLRKCYDEYEKLIKEAGIYKMERKK